MRINVGCGEHYEAGWTNTDTRAEAGPDVLTVQGEPWPFDDGTAEQVCLGHVMEHVPWALVPSFVAEVRRVLVPGGKVVAFGPDIYKAIRGWQEGTEPWELMESCHESDPDFEATGVLSVSGARHEWNCTGARVVAALGHGGLVAEEVVPTDPRLDGWPIISRAPWQFFAVATNPGYGFDRPC